MVQSLLAYFQYKLPLIINKKTHFKVDTNFIVITKHILTWPKIHIWVNTRQLYTHSSSLISADWWTQYTDHSKFVAGDLVIVNNSPHKTHKVNFTLEHTGIQYAAVLYL